MNIFKSLDLLFPCGDENRHFGEVVSTIIHFDLLDSQESISWKRKAWYVNASVNAFHMHRGLVREFLRTNLSKKLSAEESVRVKRLISLCVLNSYLAESENENSVQTHSYVVAKRFSAGLLLPSQGKRISAWELVGAKYSEIIDSKGIYLKEICDFYVSDVLTRKK